MFDNFLAEVEDFSQTAIGSDITSWLKSEAQKGVSNLVKVGTGAQGDPRPGQIGSTPPLAPPTSMQAQTPTQLAPQVKVMGMSPMLMLGLAGAALVGILLFAKGKGRA